jgi:hypothetical protein
MFSLTVIAVTVYCGKLLFFDGVLDLLMPETVAGICVVTTWVTAISTIDKPSGLDDGTHLK